MGVKRRPRSDARRGGPRGFCRGCGAPVFWLTVVKADGTRGGKAPIDRTPAFDGNIEIDLPAETYRVVPLVEAHEHREASDAGAPPRLRRNHFASCTNLTYRKLRGRVHPPSPEDEEVQKAWEDDAAVGVAVPRETPPAAVVVDEIPMPRPGEFLADPEEADGEPDE